MQDLIGHTLGHYRIVEKIGEGGMGEVYRAHDERLDREVAIKVLPASVAQDPDRVGRFKREAQAVAKLDHPNILAIHDFGADGGVAYSVTELLEGETLRERLEAGALGWRKGAEIGASIADGLAAAHGAGIIHRDLKPDNIFITADGRVKILDFGLARDVAASTPDETHSPTLSRYTDPGAVMGTAGYMSPEQVRGKEVDHRSDVFALGCVLYEMVSGRGPFRHDEAADCLAAILRDDPAPLTGGGLHEVIGQIVFRCLEKNPGERYQSAGEVAVALRTLAAATSRPRWETTPEAASIAVLPFANLSPDPEQEYFCDGMTEEIITDLSKIGSLQVTSRTSAWKFKDTNDDIPTIAAELGVRYVLEGSVRRTGDEIRITAQLIDATSDTHLWAEKYSGTVEKVFEIQEKVSRSIVDGLELRLTPDECRQIEERPIGDVRAYEFYLRAQQEVWASRWVAAIQLAKQALEIVGDNGLLYYTMGHAHMMQMLWGETIDPGNLQEAERCADKVSTLNPGSAQGFTLRAMIHYKKGERVEAARLFDQALAIDPNNYDALIWLTSLYLRAGQAAPQKPLVQKLLKIDPLSFVNHTWEGWIDWWETGSATSLQKSFRKMIEMDPNHPYGLFFCAFSLAQAGRPDEASGPLDTLVRRFPEMAFGRIARFFRAALKNDRDEAKASVSWELEGWARWDDFSSWLMADCCALIGDVDQAFEWMNNAIRLGFINHPVFSRDRFLDRIRDDPRFDEIMRGVKVKWETFGHEEEPAVHQTALDDSTQSPSLIARRWPHALAVVIAVAAAFIFLLPPQGLFERAISDPVAGGPPRIVVLPFENLGSPDDEYFADGITEEITSRLAAVSGLQVISRTSAMQYKGQRPPLRQISEELDVGYVLEGTIRWDRGTEDYGRVRITPQLIRVADDSHLWSERYDRVLEDIFAVQTDIAQAVISQLQATLLEPEQHAVEACPTENMEAYQAYLVGYQYYSQALEERNLRLAVEMLTRAVELDPDFAVAYAALSEADAALYHLRFDFTPERIEMARVSAERALALQPDLPEGHRALAMYYYYGLRDYDRALEQFAKAEEGLPNDAGVLSGLFYVLRRQGRSDEALQALERWQRVDPQRYIAAVEAANTYRFRRDFAKSEKEIRRAITIAPDLPDAYVFGLRNYVQWDGTTDRARIALEATPELDSPDIEYQSLLLDLYDRKPGEVLARLEEMPVNAFNLQEWFVPRELLECICLSRLSELNRAEAVCASAVEVLEREISARPHDYRLHIALGRTLAILGPKEKAVRAGEHAVELVPISKDALDGSDQARELAKIYAQVGEIDKALDLIDELLSIPCDLSVGLLRLDPVWDPLRDDPRFQALLEKYGGEQ